VKYMVYLCGPIEDAKDGGSKWRERLTPDLEKLGLHVFDPCIREADVSGLPVVEHKTKMTKIKEQGQWELFLKDMAPIRDQDITAVSKSLFLIALVPDSDGAQMGGTVHEIVKAWEQKIPVLWKCSGSVSKVNSWILSLLLETGRRFDTWDSMLDHIKEEYTKKIKDEEK